MPEGMPPVGVQVEGLIAMKKALRLAHDGTQHAIQARLKGVAQLVASEVAGRVPVGNGPARGSRRPGKWPRYASGSAQRSVRAVATQESASVVAGGPTAPYFGFLDFGGSTGYGHQDHVAGSGQVKREWMGRGGSGGGEGRYIYPAIRDMSGVISEEAGEAVHEALMDAGFEAG